MSTVADRILELATSVAKQEVLKLQMATDLRFCELTNEIGRLRKKLDQLQEERIDEQMD